jgi:hypothetical protein
MNILCIESFCPQKTHNRTLLFGSHFDYWNQSLNMNMRICYLWSWSVVIPGGTHMKPITSSTAVFLPSVSYLLTLPRFDFPIFSRGLCYDAVSIWTIRRQIVGWLMNWKQSKYMPSICIEGLKKTTWNYSQDSRCPGPDTNWAPPKYKPRMLPLFQPVRLVGILEWRRKTNARINEAHSVSRQTTSACTQQHCLVRVHELLVLLRAYLINI